jgi:hypothetical protein
MFDKKSGIAKSAAGLMVPTRLPELREVDADDA